MRITTLLSALLLTLACRADRPESVVLPVAGLELDPSVDAQLVTLHPIVAATFFDHTVTAKASDQGWAALSEGVEPIILDQGWALPERGVFDSTEPITFAWTTSREAVIRATRSMHSPLDFVARCRPFRIEGRTQTLKILFGGAVTTTLPLVEGWQDVRIALPETSIDESGNEFVLSFEYAEKVGEIRPESSDPRHLAAAFEYLAIVPRGIDPSALITGRGLDPRLRKLTLTVDSSARFLLPAGSEVTVRIGSVVSSCRRCELEISHLVGGEEIVLWRGKATTASERKISLSTPDLGLSRLQLALLGTGSVVRFPGRAPGGAVEVLLPATFIAAERRPKAPQRSELPHVFIYLIDTLRADALGLYGSKRASSPRIDEFARDAVIYRNTWSTSSWTLPATVSILTGVYPDRHRIMQGSQKLTEENAQTLASLLSEVGYETFGISQSFVAGQRFGLDLGFDRFAMRSWLNRSELRSREVRQQLLSILLDRERSADPIFAYIHTVDPHEPYAPQGDDRLFTHAAPGQLDPSRYVGQVFVEEGLGDDSAEVAHMRALYDGEVLHADREFGRFVRMLQYLDLYEDSVVVLVSDHGEEFGDHQGFGHGRTLYEELLRVPLIIKYPRAEFAGTEISQRVSTVDVFPTILRSIGVPAEAKLDGKSLRPPDLEGSHPSQRIVVAEVNPVRSKYLESVDYRALAVEDLKCITSADRHDQFGNPIPEWQIFDLAVDPQEQQPLEPTLPSGERCRSLMQRWDEARRLSAPAAESPVAAEALEELRALGYIE